MHHPSSIQWQCFIDIMQPIVDNIKPNNFDMEIGAADHFYKDPAEQYVCKTVLCVGGWVAVAYGLSRMGYDFTAGGAKMAELLGFNNRYELLDWASQNPDRWLNNDGYDMFAFESAYKNDKNKTSDKIRDKGMKAVMEHWKLVRDRQLEIEEGTFEPFKK